MVLGSYGDMCQLQITVVLRNTYIGKEETCTIANALSNINDNNSPCFVRIDLKK